MTTPTITPVRREVTVNADIERAFQIFTTHFDSWWPRAHHIGHADLRAAIIEPRAGGRWYEIGVDGSECEWGRVLTWDAPHHVVLSWHLNGRFQYDPDPAHASEVSVSFHAIPPDRTTIALEHRFLERMLDSDAARQGLDSDGGWRGILAGYAALVAAASR